MTEVTFTVGLIGLAMVVTTCNSGSNDNTDGAAGTGGMSGAAAMSGAGGTGGDDATGSNVGTSGNAGIGDNAGTGGLGAGTLGLDASTGDDAGGTDGTDSGVNFNACASTNVCTADYPCQSLPAPSLGYTCRGQFADWKPKDSATFTNNGDGTVTDLNTGLSWQQTVDWNHSYNLADAKAYCAGLSLAGTGWRLPTKAELESIVDYSVSNPSIDVTTFIQTTSRPFSSSSPMVGVGGATGGAAWFINFNDGRSDAADTSSRSQVRCVRSDAPVMASAGSGGAPPSRYTVDAANGTVYDTLTQLTWQRAVPTGIASCSGNDVCTQQKASAYCSELSLAGTTGWRLPAISELLTLDDPTRYDPASDAFPNAPQGFFWTSSAYVGYGVGMPGIAWVVTFPGGYAGFSVMSAPLRFRCVH